MIGVATQSKSTRLMARKLYGEVVAGGLSAETLAQRTGEPLLLVQKELRAMSSGRSPKICSPGVTTEDGEVRVLFAKKPEA